MFWQGISFAFSSGDISSTMHLAIDQVPKLILDSEFSWGSAFVTIFGSFIAGFIPALISLKAIKSNNNLLISQVKLNHVVERVNKIREFSARYAAEMETMFSSLLAKRRMLPESTGGILNEMFDAAAKVNTYSNSIVLLLNTDIPESKTIENNIKRCEDVIRTALDKGIPLDAVQIPGLQESLNEFVKNIRIYLKVEMDSIRNS
ncbi:hypothetical protein ACW6B4_001350 [Yersinia ruckeri]|uniref:hypothetical protein n=1 Tax=Yersinia ruckeri TaxID=29486 RepID=UPI00131569D1|nr:hypothetical protein [Yersinia ruckeri]WMS04263.1 hypothetical protein RDY86_09845 [Yersinia ruckeri]